MAEERRLADVRFATVAEVASLMRVSKMTVYRLVHSGELPAVRVGRSFRVPESAVHDYLKTSFIDTARHPEFGMGEGRAVRCRKMLGVVRSSCLQPVPASFLAATA